MKRNIIKFSLVSYSILCNATSIFVAPITGHDESIHISVDKVLTERILVSTKFITKTCFISIAQVFFKCSRNNLCVYYKGQPYLYVTYLSWNSKYKIILVPSHLLLFYYYYHLNKYYIMLIIVVSISDIK